MDHALARLTRFVPGVNEREFTLDDFYKIAADHQIYVAECRLPIAIRGYFTSTTDRNCAGKWIVFNDRLSNLEKLHVGLHELVHYFLHASFLDHATYFCQAAHQFDSRNDFEADVLSLVWLIPRRRLLEIMTEPPEIIAPELAPRLIRRLWILEKYKI